MIKLINLNRIIYVEKKRYRVLVAYNVHKEYCVSSVVQGLLRLAGIIVCLLLGHHSFRAENNVHPYGADYGIGYSAECGSPICCDKLVDAGVSTGDKVDVVSFV
jgi:hypothetical protein